MDSVVSASKAGLVNRQPIEVSNEAPGRDQALPGFSVTHGARVIDSTPPAITTSASPAAIICRAVVIAVRPEAHSLLTVKPGTVSGRPASSPAMRATLRLSSPAWFEAPNTISSTSAGSMPARSMAVRTTSAARSSGRLFARAPPYRPIGVRTPSRRKASGMRDSKGIRRRSRRSRCR